MLYFENSKMQHISNSFSYEMPATLKNLPNESFDEFLKESVARKMVLPIITPENTA